MEKSTPERWKPSPPLEYIKGEAFTPQGGRIHLPKAEENTPDKRRESPSQTIRQLRVNVIEFCRSTEAFLSVVLVSDRWKEPPGLKSLEG